MITVLTAATLLTPLSTIERPRVVIEDGTIVDIRAHSALQIPGGARKIDFPDSMFVPAYFDIHTHGAAGHDVMEGTDEAFDAIGQFLARRGVGAYLPTTVTASIDRTLQSLESIARQIDRANRSDSQPGNARGARPLGIHLEGPFLSHTKRGVHLPEFLQNPSIDLLRRFWEAANGKIVLMTVAPELPQALDFICEAVHLGIRVSLGHSNADTRQARAGIAAGAASATHTFNAMRALDHREPGLLGVVLDDADLFAELICDGIHVDPVLVRMFLRMKGQDRGILITDAMSAAGMPEGIYKLGVLEVTVADGKCTCDGKLAGSVLTLDQAVRNFVKFTNASYGTAVRYAATNPARLMGFSDAWGELAPGRPANIAVLSSGGEVQATVLRGEVFRA